MFAKFLRHFSRPLAKKPIGKRMAIMLTLGGICVMALAFSMVAMEWGALTWAHRGFWIASMIVSVWMLPWTWANFLNQRKREI